MDCIVRRVYSTVDGRSKLNAIEPERNVIAEGYKLLV